MMGRAQTAAWMSGASAAKVVKIAEKIKKY